VLDQHTLADMAKGQRIPALHHPQAARQLQAGGGRAFALRRALHDTN
jgi:hypothetical protein